MAEEVVKFHFLLLAIGELFRTNHFVTAQKLQDYILADEAFGVRVPLTECRLALMLMENSGWLIQLEDDPNVYVKNPA